MCERISLGRLAIVAVAGLERESMTEARPRWRRSSMMYGEQDCGPKPRTKRCRASDGNAPCSNQLGGTECCAAGKRQPAQAADWLPEGRIKHRAPGLPPSCLTTRQSWRQTKEPSGCFRAQFRKESSSNTPRSSPPGQYNGAKILSPLVSQ